LSCPPTFPPARTPSPRLPDGPTRTLATILDPEGNPIGLASHAVAPPKDD